jgi:hypothetical protein
MTAYEISEGQIFETMDRRYQLKDALPPFSVERPPTNVHESYVQVVLSDAEGNTYNDENFDLKNLPDFLTIQHYFYTNANRQQLLRTDILLSEIKSPVGNLQLKQ